MNLHGSSQWSKPQPFCRRKMKHQSSVEHSHNIAKISLNNGIVGCKFSHLVEERYQSCWVWLWRLARSRIRNKWLVCERLKVCVLPNLSLVLNEFHDLCIASGIAMKTRLTYVEARVMQFIIVNDDKAPFWAPGLLRTLHAPKFWIMVERYITRGWCHVLEPKW